MWEQGSLQEIIGFIILWSMTIIFVEAMVELLLTAQPLEEVRSWFARKSPFIAGLLSCGYCFSVWVAMSVAWLLPSPMHVAIELGAADNYLIFCENYFWWFVNGILLHRLSNIFHVRVAHQKLYDVIDEDGDE